MEAKEFVKKFGWDEARKCIPYCSKREDFIYYKNIGINFNDLKTLVDAYELVESRGGLSEAKAIEQQYWNSGVGSAMFVAMEIKQAIKLVEQCQ